MSDTQLAISSLVVGALVSAAISWYFFRKSVDRRLSAYLQLASPVLAGIDDPEIRKALEIRYRGTKIEDLLQLQFVIANEGQRAIRDLLEPLSLTLPKTAKLLEASVLHVEPKGREVTIVAEELPDGRTRVEFRFKLLNKGEFFFVKMLLNGQLDTDRLRFAVSVDDLPPSIIPKARPFRTPEDEPTTGIGAILLGIVPLVVALGTSFGMLQLSYSRPDLFPGGRAFHWLSWSTFSIALWLGGIIYWLVRSMHLMVARGMFGPRQRFHLPRRVRAQDYSVMFQDRYGRYIEPEHLMMLERRMQEDGLSPVEIRRYLWRLQMQRPMVERDEDPTA